MKSGRTGAAAATSKDQLSDQQKLIDEVEEDVGRMMARKSADFENCQEYSELI